MLNTAWLVFHGFQSASRRTWLSMMLPVSFLCLHTLYSCIHLEWCLHRLQAGGWLSQEVRERGGHGGHRRLPPPVQGRGEFFRDRELILRPEEDWVNDSRRDPARTRRLKTPHIMSAEVPVICCVFVTLHCRNWTHMEHTNALIIKTHYVWDWELPSSKSVVHIPIRNSFTPGAPASLTANLNTAEAEPVILDRSGLPTAALHWCAAARGSAAATLTKAKQGLYVPAVKENQYSVKVQLNLPNNLHPTSVRCGCFVCKLRSDENSFWMDTINWVPFIVWKVSLNGSSFWIPFQSLWNPNPAQSRVTVEPWRIHHHASRLEHGVNMIQQAGTDITQADSQI